MPRGSVRRALWLACLVLPACGYNPKKPTDTRLDAGDTISVDSAAGVGRDAGAAKDAALDGRATDTVASGPEVGAPDASGPATDSDPALDVPALDAVTSRLDATVFLDVGSTADRPVFLDVPQPAPDAPPSDAPRVCSAPPAPPRWADLAYDGGTVGSVATYTCQSGYRPTTDGSSLVTKICRADGTWQGPTIECGLLNCGPPPTVPNGRPPQYTATTLDSKAKYSCQENYSLAGSDELTCEKDGKWSYPPACNPILLRLAVNIIGSAANTVTSPTVGISCGFTCEVMVQAGTEVTLTANTAPEQVFLGWSGSRCSGTETKCVFTMSAETITNAKFSPPPNIMFVTSTKQSANLGGLAGADALCNQRAKAVSPPLRGTYKAWLSTATASAASRMGTASGWVRPDGLPVLDRLTDLIPGKMFYPPRLDETGADQGHTTVMTASTTQGTISDVISLTTCDDFRSTANPTDTHVLGGLASASGYGFTDSAWLSCQDEQRIYCMGVDNAATLVLPTPVQGRYAFTTKGNWLPGGGIASADAFCQKEAIEAALAGTYKALLATDGYSAASRFAASGLPWIRSDGMRLTATAAEFFTKDLLDLPPNRSADGTRYIGGYALSWSGASTMTTAGTLATTCLNWQSSQLTDMGRAGKPGVTGAVDFFGGLETNCNASQYLVCLQE